MRSSFRCKGSCSRRSANFVQTISISCRIVFWIFPRWSGVRGGFHSSLLPIASEDRPDVLKLCSNYFTFSFKLMKSAILWKGVIVVSIWSVKPRWVDHQLAIMASCIPWKPPFRTLLSKESKEFWTIWNFYQMGSFSGIILLPNLDFCYPSFYKSDLRSHTFCFDYIKI